MFWKMLAVLAGVGVLANLAIAVEGDSLWSHTYGPEMAESIVSSGDGGFLLLGGTNTLGPCPGNMYLVRVNAQGDTLWTRTYGRINSDDWGYSIIPSGDGGFMLAGKTNVLPLWPTDMYLVKINAQGDTLWTRTYGSSQFDEAYCIIPSGDGGFLLAGETSYSSNRDVLLFKVNSQGDPLWAHTYGGSNYDCAYDIIPSDDGNFLMVGYSQSFGAGDADIYLIKVDPQGGLLWYRTYRGPAWERARSIVPSGDGGYLIAGDDMSNMILYKVDAQGDSLWSHSYGGINEDGLGKMIPTNDGGFLLAGYSFSFGVGGRDMYLVKVNAQGNQLWYRTYGSPGWDAAYSIIPSGDGNYMLAGEVNGFNYQMWLVKVEGPPNTHISITLQPQNPPITIPATGGSFNYNITVANDSSMSTTFNTWIMVRLPSQMWYGPISGPFNVTLHANTSITRIRNQRVTATFPQGEYWYEARVGDYPTVIWDTSGFAFTKLGSGITDGFMSWPDTGLSDCSCTGDPFPGESASREIHPLSFILYPSSPNPFNPITSLRYDLPAASHVTLAVFDVAGRLVSTLVNGWTEAGVHAVTFDGSGLPSGVYLYRMTAGEWTATGKMVLLK